MSSFPKIQTSAVFKLDTAAAGAWAHDHDLPMLEIWFTGFCEGSGAVGRANGIYDISPIQCFFNLVSDRRTPAESPPGYAFTVDASAILDSP
jgi:hypothetical protein